MTLIIGLQVHLKNKQQCVATWRIGYRLMVVWTFITGKSKINQPSVDQLSITQWWPFIMGVLHGVTGYIVLLSFIMFHLGVLLLGVSGLHGHPTTSGRNIFDHTSGTMRSYHIIRICTINYCHNMPWLMYHDVSWCTRTHPKVPGYTMIYHATSCHDIYRDFQ